MILILITIILRKPPNATTILSSTLSRTINTTKSRIGILLLVQWEPFRVPFAASESWFMMRAAFASQMNENKTERQRKTRNQIEISRPYNHFVKYVFPYNQSHEKSYQYITISPVRTVSSSLCHRGSHDSWCAAFASQMNENKTERERPHPYQSEISRPFNVWS
jgi:hypothetical protein